MYYVFQSNYQLLTIFFIFLFSIFILFLKHISYYLLFFSLRRDFVCSLYANEYARARAICVYDSIVVKTQNTDGSDRIWKIEQENTHQWYRESDTSPKINTWLRARVCVCCFLLSFIDFSLDDYTFAHLVFNRVCAFQRLIWIKQWFSFCSLSKRSPMDQLDSVM